MKRRKSTAVLLFPFLATLVRADQSVQFEPLVDIDYAFFLANPAIPWLSDPFQKNPGFMNVTTQEKEYHLQGIAYQGAQSSAIVDGRAVRLGDSLGGRRVAQIGRNFVVLEKDDSQIELVLPPLDSSNPDAQKVDQKVKKEPESNTGSAP